MENIYYLFLLVMVSLGSSYITLQLPALKAYFKRIFTRTKRQTQNVSCVDMEARITELETQMNNIAERQLTQQRNRKYNIRRDVREYLEELKK